MKELNAAAASVTVGADGNTITSPLANTAIKPKALVSEPVGAKNPEAKTIAVLPPYPLMGAEKEATVTVAATFLISIV